MMTDTKSPNDTTPLTWQNLDEAMKDPLFYQCRGIMGTTNIWQDEALLNTLKHFAALASQQVLSLAVRYAERPSNIWKTYVAHSLGDFIELREFRKALEDAFAAPVQVAPALTDKEIYALWLECEIPTEANNHTTGPVPFARALLARVAPMQAPAAADDARDAALKEDQEREAFEHAMKAQGRTQSWLFRDGSGGYTLIEPALKWEGWKYRAALSTPAAKPAEPTLPTQGDAK